MAKNIGPPKPGERRGSYVFVELGGWYVAPKSGKRVRLGRFRCDCGNVVERRIGNFRNAKMTRCSDCARADGSGSVTHGESRRTGLYESWSGMKQRTNPGSGAQVRNPAYVGIDRCPEWDSFEAFRDDMGSTWFEGATIDRIDTTKGYWPDNCQWLSKSDHGKKTRSDEKRNGGRGAK